MTPPAIQNILVATDFRASSQRAVRFAASLAKSCGGRLIVQHTYELPFLPYAGLNPTAIDWDARMRAHAQSCLDAVVATLGKSGVRASGVLAVGRPSEQILLAAGEASADLIVVGTHGRHGLSHALLGSVAEKLVRTSPLPVMTVREPGSGDTTRADAA
jgi:nucleotide-binding universal stress UspA family protein